MTTNVTFAQNAPRSTPSGPDFLKALAFAQHFAKPAALTPENDRQLKATILKALQEKPPVISFAEVKDIFDEKEFAEWNAKDQLTIARMDVLLTEALPKSRGKIFPALVDHTDLLTTQFDMIDEPHQRAANEFAGWIAKNYSAKEERGVSVICTGNSRRSVMGATMGNVAAAYWGLSNLKFYSAGTTPTALNARTIETLKKVGIEVANTTEEAPRGKGGEANLIYQVSWGTFPAVKEYSKRYTDSPLPEKDFAAILVCDEADEACPTVKGASIRISAPYFDPKAYDNSLLESAKYAERRDDIGRMMLSALMQARRQLQLPKK